MTEESQEFRITNYIKFSLPKAVDFNRPLPNIYLERFAQRLALGVDRNAAEALSRVLGSGVKYLKCKNFKAFAATWARRIRPRVIAILEDLAKESSYAAAKRRELLMNIAQQVIESDVTKIVVPDEGGRVTINLDEWRKGGIAEVSFYKDKETGQLILERIKGYPKSDAIYAISELNRMDYLLEKLKGQDDVGVLNKFGIQINVIPPAVRMSSLEPVPTQPVLLEGAKDPKEPVNQDRLDN